MLIECSLIPGTVRSTGLSTLIFILESDKDHWFLHVTDGGTEA